MECNRIAFVIALSAIPAAGYTQSPPSDDVIHSILTRSLKADEEFRSNYCGMGMVTRIDGLHVVKRGERNGSSGYWPIRVQFAGRCESNPFGNLGTPAIKDFQAMTEYAISKNDFGEWRIRHLSRPQLRETFATPMFPQKSR